MSDSTESPERTAGSDGDPLAAIDAIVQEYARRLQHEAELEAAAHARRQQFLVDFATICQQQVRPAMEAVIERLRANGGDGLVAEGHGGVLHQSDPRLTAWMSLHGEIPEAPSTDIFPYLQLDAEAYDQKVQVSEGDMCQKHGHSGPVGTWKLSEITAEAVTARLVAILRRAAS